MTDQACRKPAEGGGFSVEDALSNVGEARRPRVAKRLSDMPVSARLGYIRAASGVASPRQAIKAFCYECCGYDRHAVTTCPARVCPLWPYRPGRRR